MKIVTCVMGILLALALSSTASAAICGDGVRQGGEECDNGYDNSDSRPDACRMNCKLPSCGDRVADTGEECDDGNANSDTIANACRTNCEEPRCGDGILDYEFGEVCDDGNTNEYDGCHKCQKCYKPADGLRLTVNGSYIDLCTDKDRYGLHDLLKDGAIIVEGDDITLNCHDVKLVGTSLIPDFGDMFSGFSFFGQQVQTTPPEQTIVGGAAIKITGNRAVVRNCKVSNFRTAIEIDPASTENILIYNQLCGNTFAIDGDKTINYGVNNTCDAGNEWKEKGRHGCSYQCPATQ